MRYFTVTYYRQPNGGRDESVVVRRSLRPRHWSECSVIVDFAERRVVKASLEGTNIPLDFDTIVNYYYEFYSNIINEIAQHNGYSVRSQPQTDPD